MTEERNANNAIQDKLKEVRVRIERQWPGTDWENIDDLWSVDWKNMPASFLVEVLTELLRTYDKVKKPSYSHINNIARRIRNEQKYMPSEHEDVYCHRCQGVGLEPVVRFCDDLGWSVGYAPCLSVQCPHRIELGGYRDASMDETHDFDDQHFDAMNKGSSSIVFMGRMFQPAAKGRCLPDGIVRTLNEEYFKERNSVKCHGAEEYPF